ncbi:uncharacterized membrane protein C3orf80 homolog [Cololabis saira]|uniref:uncharacterized membrane protein C3orf80 homolog n=1 Tax=Cololabis saira TaxID=129043 RepID=UPI002AD29780|nr:uncharacterized membrane protein C3orf80 homolog [Cololabis saira]
MKPRLLGFSRTTRTFISACLISACHAAHRSCEELQCAAGQQCCPPGGPAGNNGSSSGSGGSSGAALRCCKLPIHMFFDNVGWITRKLSGILILLLLFAMGYFIQRIICPRPRSRHHRSRTERCEEEEPSSSSLFNASASQDSLLARYYPERSLGGFSSPSLPNYDEVKYLPTYEESMREVHISSSRDRSEEHLLSGSEGPRSGGAAAGDPASAPPDLGPRGPGEQRRDLPAPQRSPRTSRNSV